MFKSVINNIMLKEQEERDRLNNLTEKELLIEVILELKKISYQCDDISRKIVIWNN